MYGRYVKIMDRQLVGGEDTLLWRHEQIRKQKLKVKQKQHKNTVYSPNIVLPIYIKCILRQNTYDIPHFISMSNSGRRTVHK
jgi:hypothetical protein